MSTLNKIMRDKLRMQRAMALCAKILASESPEEAVAICAEGLETEHDRGVKTALKVHIPEDEAGKPDYKSAIQSIAAE